MLLVLLVLLRSDLLDSWKKATPADAPNRFVINLQPDQEGPFKTALRDAGVRQWDWYPMIRGRLVAVNGKEVSAQSYGNERAQRLVEREFNLSHAAQPPAYNRIVAGAWKSEDPQGLSVEEGLAQTLGLKGDEQITIHGLGASLKPRQDMEMAIKYADGATKKVPLLCRILTLDELDYFRHGGIMQYVLRQLAA